MYRHISIFLGLFAVVAAPAVSADEAGKAVYESKCAVCHRVGVAGAPKLGDKAAWEPRLGAGKAALVQSVIKGKGAMPPRAGMNVSDAEASAAVEYMIEKVQ